jgi:serine protease Do
MHFPRLPDWLIYVAAVLALLIAAVGRQERADAPAAPPPVPGEAGLPLSAFLPFDPARILSLPRHVEVRAGTAFSVSDAGVWLTAAHVLKDCRQTAVVVAEGRGVAAEVSLAPGADIAVLKTRGGAPALPLGEAKDIASADLGFHPGFPQGSPGEVASRLLGSDTLRTPGRHERSRGDTGHSVLAWTEVGRTDGLKGVLDGLSGAPVLDAAGEVVGLTLAEAPRRGRLYTTTPQAIRAALAAAGVKPSAFAHGDPISVENYGRVADGLRRDLRVAKVVCLGS